jgi:flavin-dependent dehydrogenase
VLEKGSEVGAHILSGAVMDPRAITELFPDWKAQGAPLGVPVSEDRFLFLTEAGAVRTPNWMLPGCFKNHGNYVISLGNVCRWLGQQAEALGVEIFAGFAGAEVLYDDKGAVRGFATGDMGVNRKGEKTDAFQPGVELLAKYTFFAEGCRGHLGKQLETKFKLREGVDSQVYGLGLKELWEVKPDRHQPGLVVHTAGWPLDSGTYGGSFLYHFESNLVAVGFVVGLAYTNPYLSPYEEFQRYKTHPAIRGFFRGKRIAYGARRRGGRAAGAAQARVPRRLPDRRRRGIAQRLAHQGQSQRDQVRHDGRRSGARGARGRALGRRAGRLSRGLPAIVAFRRAVSRAQFQAVDGQRPVHRHPDGGHRPGGIRRQGPLDAAPCACRP